MPHLQPADREALATAVADTVVITADADAPHSGLYYWEISRRWREAVVDAVRADGVDPAIRTLAGRLYADPADPMLHSRLKAALIENGPASVLDLGWRSECNNRLGHHLGSRYERDTREPEVTVEELVAMPAGRGLPDGADPAVLIVIPFRDRSAGRARLRNLLACLLALRDQSYPRDQYQVVVVETDTSPRWRELVAPLADHYLFAPKEDDFNRSWAANAGVVNAPGNAEVICICDADVLADREFVARNAERFRRPGTMGHMPYRDMLCLDDISTRTAIRERLVDRGAATDLDRARGFTLRRGPGCCVWVRADAFHRIDGMDERYEGWGGEDIDFNYRFEFDLAYDSYSDPLIHMRHPPSSALREDGELTNAHIPPLSWRPDAPIGRLDRFATVPA